MKQGTEGAGGRGFTLIELLVVIAIIGILAALLLPVVGRVRTAGQTTSSLSNLKQIHVLIFSYVDDNRGFFPTPRGLDYVPDRYWRRRVWEHSFGEFSTSPTEAMDAMRASAYSKIMWCPVMAKRFGQDEHPFGRGSYGMNYYFLDPQWGGSFRSIGNESLVGTREPMVMAGTRHPADARFGTEPITMSTRFPYDTVWNNMAYEYNGEGSIGLYLDGHARTITKEEGTGMAEMVADWSKLE